MASLGMCIMHADLIDDTDLICLLLFCLEQVFQALKRSHAKLTYLFHKYFGLLLDCSWEEFSGPKGDSPGGDEL